MYTIEWPFIQNVLRRFNFGQVLRKRISVLYSDVESALLNGGYSTNYYTKSLEALDKDAPWTLYYLF